MPHIWLNLNLTENCRYFGKIILLSCCCGLLPLMAQEAPLPEYTPEQADSVRQLQEEFRKQNERSWEKIVAFPGRLLYLPLQIINSTITGTVIFVSETQLIPKTFDLLTSDDGKRQLMPVYNSRRGPGLKYEHKSFLASQGVLSLQASAWTMQRQFYQARLNNLMIFDTTIAADIRLNYQFLPDEPFYGIGNASSIERRSNFAREQFLAEIAFGLNFNSQTRARLAVGVERNNLLAGRSTRFPPSHQIFNPQAIPGLRGSLQFISYAFQVERDTRNHPGQPTAGGTMLFRASLLQQIGEKGERAFGFYRITADFNRVLELFYQRSLVVRLAGQYIKNLDQREVPFYYLSELGTGNTVRGYQRGRFRDRSLVLGSLEYRYPIWEFADAYLFGDAGQVGFDLSEEFSLSDLHSGIGGGLRVWSADGLISNLALAKSSEGYRFYFSLNQQL